MDFNYNLMKVHSPETKKYLKEVISCYDNGNYRSAINSLYSVAIVDIYQKLNDLASILDDDDAKKKLKSIEELKKKKEQNKKDDSIFDSNWENKLINEAKKTSIFDSNRLKTAIDQLKRIRNSSSHPALKNGKAYLEIPDQYEVVHYMNVLFSELFMMPPTFLGSVTSDFVEQLSENKNTLLNNPHRIKLYIINRFLSNMNKRQIRDLTHDLFKFVFVLDNDDCNNNRDINYQALTVLLKLNKDNLDHIIEQKELIKRINLDSVTDYLMKLSIEHNKLWHSLTEEQKETIIEDHCNESMVGELELALINSGQQFKEKVLDFNKRISADANVITANEEDFTYSDVIFFERSAKEVGVESDFYKLCILLFGNSRSFATAKTRYEKFIAKNLKMFNKDYPDLMNLLTELSANNNQIYECYSESWGKTIFNRETKTFLALSYN